MVFRSDFEYLDDVIDTWVMWPGYWQEQGWGSFELLEEIMTQYKDK